MEKTIPFQKTIGWNGLSLAIPASWDTIVRDDRHLIFEQELRPVLELRWELPSSNSYGPTQGERIIAQLQKEAGRTLIPADPPRSLIGFTPDYHIQCFNPPSSSTGECALLTCITCGAPILLKFYSDFYHQVVTDPKIIGSLTCWHAKGTDSQWAVHDISFRLPQGFSLDSHSFRFGLSSLSFSTRTSQLTLCRLAPASEHLKRNSFQELFASFSKSDPEQHEIIDEHTLQYAGVPGIGARLIGRLGRRKLFVVARFKHISQHDRIIGFRLESSQPIQPDTVQTIQDSYGIIQEEKTDSHIHP